MSVKDIVRFVVTFSPAGAEESVSEFVAASNQVSFNYPRSSSVCLVNTCNLHNDIYGWQAKNPAHRDLTLEMRGVDTVARHLQVCCSVYMD